MRILDQNADKALNDVIILLTVVEAKELRDEIESLLGQDVKYNHGHINDESYKKEITVALYNEKDDLSGFNDRLKKLIVHDE